jgi:aspartate/glutamate racemase
MKQTLLLVHTSPLVVHDMERAVTAAVAPSTTLRHHIDERMLPDLIERNALARPTDSVFDTWLDGLTARYVPDHIQVTCTSLSLLVDGRQRGVGPRVHAIDAELRRALAEGRWLRPLVVLTVASTRAVTMRYLGALGSGPVRTRYLFLPEAFTARVAGDVRRHNEILCDAARAAQVEHDVLLLPQASMYVAREALGDALEIPVVHAADEAARALCAGTAATTAQPPGRTH